MAGKEKIGSLEREILRGSTGITLEAAKALADVDRYPKSHTTFLNCDML